MRNMKMLGLLAISAMALVAFVGTSSASAAAKFTAEKAGNALSTTLVENHVFTVEGSAVECEEIAFNGETEGTATESQTVAPSYKKCKAFGFASATVNTGTCKFTFKAATDEASMATVNLSGCADATKGIQIEVNVPFVAKCVVDVPHQSISSAVGYTNGAGNVTVKATATSVMNDVTTSTGLCPLKVGTNSTGAYNGASSVSAAGGVQWDAS